MKEVTFKSTEIAEGTESEQPEEVKGKPYEFRLLSSTDLFLMIKIVKKIGVKEFKACFIENDLKSLFQNAFVSVIQGAKATIEGTEDGNTTTEDTNDVSAFIGLGLDIADVILGNLPACEQDIYRLLAQTSNLSVEEIKAPGNAAMFLEMLVDFFKKEEFKDFFKVASTLF